MIFFLGVLLQKIFEGEDCKRGVRGRGTRKTRDQRSKTAWRRGGDIVGGGRKLKMFVVCLCQSRVSSSPVVQRASNFDGPGSRQEPQRPTGVNILVVGLCRK